MAKSAIGPGIDQPLDIHGKGLPQIAFNLIVLINDFTNLDDLIFAEILHTNGAVNPGLGQDLLRRGSPDPEYIGQADVRPFLPGQIHSGDTCHIVPPTSPSTFSAAEPG